MVSRSKLALGGLAAATLGAMFLLARAVDAPAPTTTQSTARTPTMPRGTRVAGELPERKSLGVKRHEPTDVPPGLPAFSPPLATQRPFREAPARSTPPALPNLP